MALTDMRRIYDRHRLSRTKRETWQLTGAPTYGHCVDVGSPIQRTTFIVGPSGSGKTTLLSRWSGRLAGDDHQWVACANHPILRALEGIPNFDELWAYGPRHQAHRIDLARRNYETWRRSHPDPVVTVFDEVYDISVCDVARQRLHAWLLDLHDEPGVSIVVSSSVPSSLASLPITAEALHVLGPALFAPGVLGLIEGRDEPPTRYAHIAATRCVHPRPV